MQSSRKSLISPSILRLKSSNLIVKKFSPSLSVTYSKLVSPQFDHSSFPRCGNTNEHAKVPFTYKERIPQLLSVFTGPVPFAYLVLRAYLPFSALNLSLIHISEPTRQA